MSTSSAPSSTTSAISRSRESSGPSPAGNAPATLATCTPVPLSCSAATGTSCGYRQTAATDGIDGSTGSGRIAFEQSATILPTVSVPSSVVRSMQRIARSSAQSFEDFLIDRFARDAARSSSPTASTATVRAMSRCASAPPDSTGRRSLGWIWLPGTSGPS